MNILWLLSNVERHYEYSYSGGDLNIGIYFWLLCAGSMAFIVLRSYYRSNRSVRAVKKLGKSLSLSWVPEKKDPIHETHDGARRFFWRGGIIGVLDSYDFSIYLRRGIIIRDKHSLPIEKEKVSKTSSHSSSITVAVTLKNPVDEYLVLLPALVGKAYKPSSIYAASALYAPMGPWSAWGSVVTAYRVFRKHEILDLEKLKNLEVEFLTSEDGGQILLHLDGDTGPKNEEEWSKALQYVVNLAKALDSDGKPVSEEALIAAAKYWQDPQGKLNSKLTPNEALAIQVQNEAKEKLHTGKHFLKSLTRKSKDL